MGRSIGAFSVCPSMEDGGNSRLEPQGLGQHPGIRIGAGRFLFATETTGTRMTAPDRFRVIQRILLPGLMAALATGVLARGGRLETPYSRPDELGRLVSDSESIFLGRCVSSVAQTPPGASAALVTVVFEVERQILGPRQGQMTLRFYRPLPIRSARLPSVPSPAEAAEPGYVAGSESARDRSSRLQLPSSGRFHS